MKITELKNVLSEVGALNFRLPDNTYVPAHFHLTEIGLVTKHFIDCGGTERKEAVANFQLWVAEDVDHRLNPNKFLKIIDLSQKILKGENLVIEVEFQQNTIGKFGLEYDGQDFILTSTQTACLAAETCGVDAPKKKVALANLTPENACCTPGGGCC